jgi:hypothetical protein
MGLVRVEGGRQNMQMRSISSCSGTLVSLLLLLLLRVIGMGLGEGVPRTVEVWGESM